MQLLLPVATHPEISQNPPRGNGGSDPGLLVELSSGVGKDERYDGFKQTRSQIYFIE